MNGATTPLDSLSPEQLYLRSIVVPLCQYPVAVYTVQTTDDRGVLLTLTVAKEDMGRIIGKQGDTARAIRRILRQFGMARDQRISIKINEPTS